MLQDAALRDLELEGHGGSFFFWLSRKFPRSALGWRVVLSIVGASRTCEAPWERLAGERIIGTAGRVFPQTRTRGIIFCSARALKSPLGVASIEAQRITGFAALLRWPSSRAARGGGLVRRGLASLPAALHAAAARGDARGAAERVDRFVVALVQGAEQLDRGRGELRRPFVNDAINRRLDEKGRREVATACRAGRGELLDNGASSSSNSSRRTSLLLYDWARATGRLGGVFTAGGARGRRALAGATRGCGRRRSRRSGRGPVRRLHGRDVGRGGREVFRETSTSNVFCVMPHLAQVQGLRSGGPSRSPSIARGSISATSSSPPPSA